MSKWTDHNAIGGYLSLELGAGGHPFHGDAIGLNSARNCFEYILLAKGYKRVHLPFYTCEAMFEAPLKLDVDICFYAVGPNLEPSDLPALGPDEAFVYTNYFGLKQSCVERLHMLFGEQLIVDNAQAFYAPALPGVDSLYSPRKFFGVPDGGYLYTDKMISTRFPQSDSTNRFQHLIKRIESGPEAGYADFREAEKTLDNGPVQTMSRLTESLLGAIDYRHAARIRRENYRILHKALADSNLIQLQMDDQAVPMVYPFLTDDPSLRQRLIVNRVFVATYWPNVKQAAAPGSTEYELADKLIPLPIDQRYGPDEMNTILQIIG